MAISDFYKVGFTIESRTETSTYSGASWSDVGTNYSGYVQPVSSSDTFKQGKSGEDVTHRFYTSVSTPCEYGYRLTWQGKKYIMVGTDQPLGISSQSSHKEILLKVFSDVS